MIEFQRTDLYKITSGKEKLKEDIKVLIRLYQPIIGAIATNLYLTFQSEITLNAKFTPSINHLLKNMHITIREFNNAFNSLMEFNLVATPKKQKNTTNSYLFKALPTLSAYDFFATEKLNNALFAVESKESYDLLRRDFGVDNDVENDYEDINVQDTFEISEDKFYINFLSKYNMLQNAIDDNVRKEVRRVKKLFKINYENIEKCLFESVDSSNKVFKIDLAKFNQLVENNFAENENVDPMKKVIEQLAITNSVTFLEDELKRRLTPSESRLIINLVQNNQINYGIMNVILDYSFKKGIFASGTISFAYITKLIESVKLAGCNDVETTMEYFKASNKKIKNNNNNTKEYAKIEVANKFENSNATKKSNEEDEDDDAELLALLG